MSMLRATPLLTITLAISTPALAGGIIEGSVKLEGAAPKVPPVKVTKDESTCGKDRPSEAVQVGSGGAIRNVVVYLKDAKAPAPPPPTTNAVLDQKGCRYEPHVQAVTLGTPLAVLNNDAVL